eukprot:CAMPEP_0181267160 /NCGR_PEP_ID=MMETSP1097-20121128/4726_1 /TAXON_ID=35684 /ORGANISM="Pseudopedinella elastica, Strain CCMP716" /LENGTH=93 /DNA_ID=CAMNT_0023366517 /DNA_START=402 /DNA_END=683 /DNA_ORIENTATION=+
MTAKHLTKPVRNRAGHAETSMSSVDEIGPTLRRPELETSAQYRVSTLRNAVEKNWWWSKLPLAEKQKWDGRGPKTWCSCPLKENANRKHDKNE